MADSNLDTWVVVSSSDEAYDSDKIDSDIEAELYSVIHHEADTVASPVDRTASQGPETNTAAPLKTNNSLKKDLNSSRNTKLYTSFETPKRKKQERGSSSDEVEIIEDLSNCKKRKSDLLDNVLGSIQLKSPVEQSPIETNCANNASARKKQKTNKRNKLKRKSDPKVGDRTIDIDTSDSDSIIWSEADECRTEIKTNVDNITVDLSSDSFSDDSFTPFLGNHSFSGSPTRHSRPSTSSCPENSNDPWFVISEDLFRSKNKKPSSRYHERAVVHCSNCNLKGHSAKFCSVPKAMKCYICGGAHMATRCKDKICCKCFGVGHDSRFCSQHLISVCVHCNMRGHLAKVDIFSFSF